MFTVYCMSAIFLGKVGGVGGGGDSQISNQAMQKFVYMYHTIYTYEVV